jgi:dephospho-CoA kinase
MAFIYVTGAPGSGKTTIQRSLSKRGIECYDIDDEVFGGPHNLLSGKKVIIPPANERSDDWFDYHEWRIYHDAFRKLKLEAVSKNIVICGVAEADTEIVNLFDKVFYLKLDDQVLKQRISDRTENDYGKNPKELEVILNRKRKLDQRYSSANSVLIDASLPLEEVIKTLLSYIVPDKKD